MRKIEIPADIPKDIMDGMDDIFVKDGNCLTMSEFRRYVIRLFNEFISNHMTVTVNDTSELECWERCVMMKRFGEDLFSEYRYKYMWRKTVNTRITITYSMMDDIRTYSVFFKIRSFSDYIGIAFMWAIRYYEKMGDKYETLQEQLGERALKEHFQTIDPSIESPAPIKAAEPLSVESDYGSAVSDGQKGGTEIVWKE